MTYGHMPSSLAIASSCAITFLLPVKRDISLHRYSVGIPLSGCLIRKSKTMDPLQGMKNGAMSSKPLTKATSAQDTLRFEPMAEYHDTQDDTDLARFGKRQRLNVSILILNIAPSVCEIRTKNVSSRGTLVSGQL